MRTWIAVLLVLTALAYTGFFLSLSNVPLTDAPNHLARAVVMKSLWSDPHSPFLGMFSASHSFMPYMLSDLGLILLLGLLGSGLAYPVWSTLTVLIFVLGVWIYARQLLATSWAVAAVVLCSWYFATDYLFILGFFAFQWGVATAFLALGALEGWRRTQKKRIGWIALYAISCFACYGMHVACFAMLAAIVGAIGVVRTFRKEQSWVRFACELFPFAILAGYHLLLVPAHPEAAGGPMKHSTVANKLARLIWWLFMRENFPLDRVLLILFGAILAGIFWFGMRRRAGLGSDWQVAAVCGLGAATYFLLPSAWGRIDYVDERALPFFAVPLLILGLSVMERSGPTRKQVTLLMAACALVAGGNLACLATFLPRQNREIAQYRQAVLTIPPGRNVLPITTRRKDGNTYPLRHIGSFYTADRNGYTPYLFSQKTGGGPSGYFSDLTTIYRPPHNWYLGKATLNWDTLRTYDYVIINKPWRRERIDLSRLELHYENDAATVFRVLRSPEPGAIQTR